MLILVCTILGWLWMGPFGAFIGFQVGFVIYFLQRFAKRLESVGGNFYRDEYYHEQYTPPKQETPHNIYSAYDTLRIPSNASDEEVKKAYRRMAMEYHPDRHVNASEQEKQAATEKFRAVNKAYEQIKKQRQTH